MKSSSEMWRGVVWQKFANVSEGQTVSIFGWKMCLAATGKRLSGACINLISMYNLCRIAVKESGLRKGHICARIRTDQQDFAPYAGGCLRSLHVELEFLAAAVCKPLM
jgi:hypothetical protein